ncbi:MAG: AAA family ATPase [Chloroflexota bacterium]|nr:AAA family ATPase [Chloroflexota bacterium]
MDHLTGTVERIVYQNDENHYTVARLKLAESAAATRYRAAPDLTTVVGAMPGINVGETLLLNGEWQVNPQHGRQFKVQTFEPRLPSTVDGIRRYLGSGLIKGIGPKTAERIVDYFGADTLEVVEQEPARLAEVSGISAKKVADIVRAWTEQKEVKNLMLFLQSHEVESGLAARIYKQYGAGAINVIRDDPYRLAKDIRGVGFKTADALARKLGLPEQSPQRHAAGLKYVLSQASDDGHVYLPRPELLTRAAEALGAAPDDLELALAALAKDRDVIIEPAALTPLPPLPCAGEGEQPSPSTIPSLKGRGDARTLPPGTRRDGRDMTGGSPLPRTGERAGPSAAAEGPVSHGAGVRAGDERAYLAPFFFSERGAAKRLKLLAETPSTLLFARNIDWVRAFAGLEGSGKIELAEGQKRAVQTALSNKVSVLTGGPGVGKTTTLRAVLHLLEHYGIRYCLAAPTGRAAKRMSEATGRHASTMHRLLEFSPANNGFAYNEENPLPYSFVIADESSMIDILLFYALLRAVPLTAHLLLVGDADQLPSVGPGNVLRDVISSQALPVTRLTELFRQARGSHIITTAHDINRGVIPHFENRGDTDLFFIKEDDPGRVIELLTTVVSERAPRAFGLDPLADVQVISPSNQGALGVSNLNVQLQEMLNPARPDDLKWGQRVFRSGDKVMQIRNNYNKNVFNGDMGRVARIDREEQTLVVQYPAEGLPIKRDDDLAAPGRGRNRPAPPIIPRPGGGGNVIEVAYEFSELDELTHAYAVSVHKSQGSEFPAVVMPLTTSHFKLLQRNLIYTAITRARRLCVLIGSPRALAIAVKNSSVDKRYTALDERLRAAPPRTLS